MSYVSKFPGKVNNISENILLTWIKIFLKYLEAISLDLYSMPFAPF